MPARTRRRAAPLAAALVLVAASVSAEILTLTLPEGRILAREAALSGRPELAREVAAGLLSADPTDRTALIVLAVVEPRLGRPDQGRMAGIRAFRVSTTKAQRFEAAYLTAKAAEASGDLTLAQLWLRRAALHTSDPTDEVLLARDFAVLRRLNPLSVRLGFGLAPSSNVNGGSREEGMEIFGLPFVFSGDSRALSGWVASGDVQLSYRLRADAESRTTLSARTYLRGVMLSDEARRIAPSVDNEDFSTVYLSLGLRQDWRAEGGVWGIDARVAGTWYGGDHAASDLRFGINRRWQGEDGPGYEIAVGFGPQWGPDGLDGYNWTLSGQMTRAADAGRLTLGAIIEGFSAMAAADAFSGARLTASYTPADPIGPVSFAFAGGLGWRDYPDYPLGAREDRRAWVQVEAALPDFDIGGFAPVVTLYHGRTESTIDRFDIDETSLGLSVRSTF